jgi:transglutaminase-like putative cysteine protease
MTINRRTFLMLTGAAAGLAALPDGVRAQERFIREPGPWRKFETVTRIDIAKPVGRVQAWVPVPAVEDAEWSKPGGSDWQTNAKSAKLKRDETSGAAFVHLQWSEGEFAPFAEITSAVATRDRSTDFSRTRKPTPLTAEERQLYTTVFPSDDAVTRAVTRITGNAMTDLGKAKAIFEWLAEPYICRNPGRAFAIRRNASNLNKLYVRLANAAGLPARVIYGLRVAPSQYGYGSLGVVSDVVTRAQHLRAEVWLEDYGWMPVDPADVCKTAREEASTGPGTGDKIVRARLTLFGAWEGNWLAYNMANNVQLPVYDLASASITTTGATPQAPAPRVLKNLTCPHAETSAGLLDCHDPDNFKYVITAKELPA